MSETYTIAEHSETGPSGTVITYSISHKIILSSNDPIHVKIAGGLKQGYAQLIASLLNENPPNRESKDTRNIKTHRTDRYSARGDSPKGMWFVYDGEITVAGVYSKFYALRIAHLLNEQLINGPLPPAIQRDDRQLLNENKKLNQEIHEMITSIDKLDNKLKANPELTHASARVPILGDITVDRTGHVGSNIFSGLPDTTSNQAEHQTQSIWALALNWLRLGKK